MAIFGENFITRNTYKLTNVTTNLLHNYLGVKHEFIKGTALGFFSIAAYPYILPIFKTMALPPVSTATEVSEKVSGQVIPDNLFHSIDVKSIIIPSAISLFFDDHFIYGNLVGMGLGIAIGTGNYPVGLLVAGVGVGVGCEWYFE